MGEIAYPGGELALFEDAKRWKAYLARQLAPHLSGRVLEVGAGIGGSTRVLATIPGVSAWTALEPDASLLARLTPVTTELSSRLGLPVRAVPGTVADLSPEERFDAIAYLDVLEHLADDRGELARAFGHLAPGGRLAVLAPAHPFLFSPFDAAIGHRCRYTRSSLEAVAPSGAQALDSRYLDSAGLLASLANRVLLRQALPSPRQLRVWDRVLIPASRVLDPLTCGRLGKSVLVVWKRPAPTASATLR